MLRKPFISILSLSIFFTPPISHCFANDSDDEVSSHTIQMPQEDNNAQPYTNSANDHVSQGSMSPRSVESVEDSKREEEPCFTISCHSDLSGSLTPSDQGNVSPRSVESVEDSKREEESCLTITASNDLTAVSTTYTFQKEDLRPPIGMYFEEGKLKFSPYKEISSEENFLLLCLGTNEIYTVVAPRGTGRTKRSSLEFIQYPYHKDMPTKLEYHLFTADAILGAHPLLSGSTIMFGQYLLEIDSPHSYEDSKIKYIFQRRLEKLENYQQNWQ